MKNLKHFAFLLGAFIIVSSCESDDQEETPVPVTPFTEVKGSGDIAGKLAEFRTLLGNPINATPGQTAGRREITWDGVPAAQTNTNTFPGDFFNSKDTAVAAGRKRGAEFTTPGTGFRTSDNDFEDLLTGYGEQFNAFSPARTFAPVGSNKTDVLFKVPGTSNGASVNGFGVVFSDVDRANSTSIEFFEGDKSLGIFTAPVRTDASGISFLGVFFPENKVTRATITSGNIAVSNKFADGAQYDVVVMDDFLYNEPKAAN
ncbi:hypothetical protein MUK70_04150 [Dyadobacter chenwenxiniae]|uniref:Uncharacterized protein n=1 Tax=Dyadobacter chenwenxiniae TaxID=2906456 RepID=A0A9X1PNR1_9BACT|nr:hypothetical protein [Dyadobacter chenwenxiniae]MCF0064762.1 hypothetical protein [Dyadobacter chenwenxiniae]UON84184.1 hypothetical protein MUK70_04150 [Dyadobacter chenwenxiniae]